MADTPDKPLSKNEIDWLLVGRYSLLIALTSLLAFLLLAVVLAPTLLSGYARGRIEREIASRVLGTVSVRAVELGWFSPQRLSGLAIDGGAEVGKIDLTLEVAGMPRFEPGGREIVFVEHAGPQICPLVAMAYGRYRVLLDAAGAEFVARDNGAPLVRPDDVALSLTAPVVAVLTSRQSLARARPLSPLEFTAAVRSEALRARLP